jgi:hypothetical protein
LSADHDCGELSAAPSATLQSNHCHLLIRLTIFWVCHRRAPPRVGVFLPPSAVFCLHGFMIENAPARLSDASGLLLR